MSTSCPTAITGLLKLRGILAQQSLRPRKQQQLLPHVKSLLSAKEKFLSIALMVKSVTEIATATTLSRV